MHYPSDAETELIHRRKMDLLAAQASTTVGGNLIAAGLVAVLTWDRVPLLPLILWCVAVTATVLLRRLRLRSADRSNLTESLPGYFRYCANSVGVNGALWGGMFAYLAYTGTAAELTYPLMVLCALAAGTSLIYNAHFNPFRNFAIPALLAPSAVMLLSGDTAKIWVAVIALSWFALMYAISIQLVRFLASTSRYETENIALIRDLEYQRERGERLNEELQLKTEIIQRLAQSQQDQQSSKQVASGH